MNIPFNTEQFLGVFQVYNDAIWPAQLIGYIVAVMAMIAVSVKYSGASRLIAGTMGVFWIWTGTAYHIIFFSEINQAAYLFGAAYILNGLIYFYFGALKSNLQFRFDGRWISIVGYVFMTFAIIVYPVLGLFFGHSYPRIPLFPLTPCPLTIFTFGVLLTAIRPVRWHIWIIPFVWSIIGFTAALRFGIKQDIGLLIAGVVGVIFILAAGRKRNDNVQLRHPSS